VSKSITDPSEFTPQYLDALLRELGLQSDASVASVIPVGEFKGTGSALYRFRVSYKGKTDERAPTQLCLKMTRPGEPGSRNREGTFYEQVAPHIDPSCLIRCYEAVNDSETGKYHILMDDISETHENAEEEWPVPPHIHRCEHAIDCLADFHGQMWNHPELGKKIGAIESNQETKVYWFDVEEMLPRFLDYLGDRISPAQRQIYEHVVSHSAEYAHLIADRPSITVRHNDAHFCNFLYPKGGGVTKMIDWEAWKIGLGSFDLAYAIALHWYPERRSLHERPLLVRYHSRLLRSISTEYSWEDFRIDYRLAVIHVLFRPVWQWEHKGPVHRWWSHLGRATSAYQDLDCAELLG